MSHSSERWVRFPEPPANQTVAEWRQYLEDRTNAQLEYIFQWDSPQFFRSALLVDYREIRRRYTEVRTNGGINMEVYHQVRSRLHQMRVVSADNAVENLDELRQMFVMYAADINTGGRDNANTDMLPRIRLLLEDITGLHRLLAVISDKVKTD